MDITKSPPLSPEQAHKRRIGKKVLSASRMSVILQKRLGNMKSAGIAKIRIAKKYIVLATVLALILTTTGIVGYNTYSNHVAQQAAAAAKTQQLEEEAALLKASQCRAQKAVEKSDKLGKITYDQLYDFDECNKTE